MADDTTDAGALTTDPVRRTVRGALDAAGLTLKQAALELGHISEADFDQQVNPGAMAAPDA